MLSMAEDLDRAIVYGPGLLDLARYQATLQTLVSTREGQRIRVSLLTALMGPVGGKMTLDAWTAATGGATLDHLRRVGEPIVRVAWRRLQRFEGAVVFSRTTHSGAAEHDALYLRRRAATPMRPETGHALFVGTAKNKGGLYRTFEEGAKTEGSGWFLKRYDAIVNDEHRRSLMAGALAVKCADGS